jgi:hypothetical protein
MLCDVVILSNAVSHELKGFTRTAVKSLVESEISGIFNIIVCEQTTWQYNHVTTLHMPEEFNYNRFSNLAIATGSAPWVCVANNDVYFQPGWFSSLLRIDDDVMSPKNPDNHLQKNIIHPVKGTRRQKYFSGWCYVMRRTVWELIGGLDEDFPFYCADSAVVRQLNGKGITPTLVPDSIVLHRIGATRKKLPSLQRTLLTTLEIERFYNKYPDMKICPDPK